MEKAVGGKVRAGAHQSGHGCREQRKRRSALHRGWHGAAHRQSHRSAARRRPAGTRGLRQGAGKPARTAYALRARQCGPACATRTCGSPISPAACPGPPTTWRCSTRPSGSLSLQGWITLSNQSGTTFRECAHAARRGRSCDITRFGRGRGMAGASSRRRRRTPGTESTDRSKLSDYYLYPIAAAAPRSPTIRPSRSASSESSDVKASKGYEVTFIGIPVQRRARLPRRCASASRTPSRAACGEPLPAGVVRVYARDSRGQPQFIGEDHVGPYQRRLGHRAAHRRCLRRHRHAHAAADHAR